MIILTVTSKSISELWAKSIIATPLLGIIVRNKPALRDCDTGEALKVQFSSRVEAT